MGMAAPPLLEAPLPRLQALQEGVEPAVPLARRLQHAAGVSVEQAAADGPLVEAGVQDGLPAQSAASDAHSNRFWDRGGEKGAASGFAAAGGGGDVRVLPL